MGSMHNTTDTELIMATAQYVKRIADLLVDYAENGEAEKTVFAIFTIDEAVSPDKPLGALFVHLLKDPVVGLIAMARDLPKAPEINAAKDELRKVVEAWEPSDASS